MVSVPVLGGSGPEVILGGPGLPRPHGGPRRDVLCAGTLPNCQSLETGWRSTPARDPASHLEKSGPPGKPDSLPLPHAAPRTATRSRTQTGAVALTCV